MYIHVVAVAGVGVSASGAVVETLRRMLIISGDLEYRLSIQRT